MVIPARRASSSETIDDLLSIIQTQQQQIAQLTQLLQSQTAVKPAILKPVAPANYDPQDVEIGITKAAGGDGNAAENYLKCMSALGILPDKPKEPGIKKLDAPQFAAPSFDDIDDIEL